MLKKFNALLNAMHGRTGSYSERCFTYVHSFTDVDKNRTKITKYFPALELHRNDTTNKQPMNSEPMN